MTGKTSVCILIITVMAIGATFCLRDIAAQEPEKGDSRASAAKLLKTESVSGKGVWIDKASGRNRETYVTVWFDRQFLGERHARAGTERHLDRAVVRGERDGWNHVGQRRGRCPSHADGRWRRPGSRNRSPHPGDDRAENGRQRGGPLGGKHCTGTALPDHVGARQRSVGDPGPGPAMAVRGSHH